MAIKVLLVEDDRVLRQALGDTLEIGGFAYQAVGSAEEALEAVLEDAFSLVVSDVNMPGMDGHQLLSQLRRQQPQLPVLLMTAHAAVERAVEAMRQGAADYLVKPFEPKALLSLVERHAAGRVSGEEGPVACEPASRQLLELAARVARSDSTVLISGESGTGKEVLARYIHQQSPRAAQPFVAINCAAIPDNMLEATLFGHEKGAFTGAIAAQAGKFEQAEGGTLLLDEISEMPMALQAKLLRVLQEREVERVGGRKPISLDIRVLATTNRDLAGEVAAGRFREDLYYRLCGAVLKLPPLRARGDRRYLIEAMFNEEAAAMGGAARLSEAAMLRLMAHDWPGNLRELRNVLRLALALCTGASITPEELRLAPHRPSLAPRDAAPTPSPADDGDSAADATRLLDALQRHRWHVARAAQALGISRATAYRHMKRFGIVAPQRG